MKIILWIENEANQVALANKIAFDHEVIGIITESRDSKTKITIKRIIEKVIEKVFLSTIDSAWIGMKDFYSIKYPKLPETELIQLENINSIKAFEFTHRLAPDLIIVSGTRLIKKKLLSLKPRIGILNLHTGLSPYVKGGPNCTNWCIASNEFHLIGNTIMWIDEGIDTGNIVTTEVTPFEETENLLDIHLKVMEHAHRLYLKAIDFLASGRMSNVKQTEIAEGKTYYNKQWTLMKKVRLKRNLRRFNEACKTGQIEELQKDVKTIEITAGDNSS